VKGKGRRHVFRCKGENAPRLLSSLPAFAWSSSLSPPSLPPAALLQPSDLSLLRHHLSSSLKARRALLASYRSFLADTTAVADLMAAIAKLALRARREGRKVSVGTQTQRGRGQRGRGKESSTTDSREEKSEFKHHRDKKRNSEKDGGRPFSLSGSSVPDVEILKHIRAGGCNRQETIVRMPSPTPISPAQVSSSSFLPILSSLNLTPVQLRALRRAIVQEDKHVMQVMREYKATRDVESFRQGLKEMVRVVVLGDESV